MPGQSNYAAVNDYMGALAHHRRSRGQAAVSVMLPMVLGVGVVAESTELEESLKRKGMYGIEEEDVLAAFELAVMEQQGEKTGGSALHHVVVGLDPTLLNKARLSAREDVDAFWERDPRFSFLVQAIKAGSGADGSGDGAGSVLESVHKAATLSEANGVVASHVAGKLSRMLMLDIDEFEDTSRSVTSFGIDGMIGAELRSWIFKKLSLDIPFQQLLAPGLTLLSPGELVCQAQGIGGKTFR